VTGTCSGDLGHARPVTGTWRNGFVDLTFDAQWKFRIFMARVLRRSLVGSMGSLGADGREWKA
jgi:hypothetical protein